MPQTSGLLNARSLTVNGTMQDGRSERNNACHNLKHQRVNTRLQIAGQKDAAKIMKQKKKGIYKDKRKNIRD